MDNSLVLFLFVMLLSTFFFFLTTFLIDSFSIREKESIKIKDQEELIEIKGNFMGRNWKFPCSIYDLKVNKVDGGYSITEKNYDKKSLTIITDLVDFETDSKNLFLEYNSYEFPVMVNGCLIDLRIFTSNIYKSNKMDESIFYSIPYYFKEMDLSKKLQDTVFIFKNDILPTINDVVTEFRDSLELENGEIELLEGLNLEALKESKIPITFSHYDNIDILTIKIPYYNHNMRFSINAFNHFLHKFIYQIEVILDSEKLNLKVCYNTPNVFLEYGNSIFIKFIVKDKIGPIGPTGPQGFQSNQGFQGPTGPISPTGYQGFQGNQGFGSTSSTYPYILDNE